MSQKESFVLKRTKLTDEQIAFTMRQAETGTLVSEVCRKMDIYYATFYNLKKKCGGHVPHIIALKTPPSGQRLPNPPPAYTCDQKAATAF